MDLFEYQARDLFAKHGVPVLAGEVIDTPEAAREATERLGGKSVVKAQVKVGGRGKAGGVKLAATPDEAVARATDILGMDIKGPHGPQGDDRRDGSGDRLRSTTSPTSSTVRTAPSWPWPRSRAAWTSRRSPPRPPRARQGPGRRQRGREHREGPRDRRAGAVPGRGRRAGRRGHGHPVEDLRRRGRAPRRGQPARQGRLRGRHRPRRQGVPGRERGLPPARARGARRQGGGQPAGGRGQGQEPQLRQAGRRGRHHRQRRRPGHVDPGRRRVRR